MRTRPAFTLIELLVVVAIIVALLAILLPAMNGAIAVAQDAKCRSQMRGVSQGFLMFAADHDRVMPGVFKGKYAGTEPWQKSWLGKEVWPAADVDGTLAPYVGGRDNVAEKDFYRCPGLADGTPGSGIGSNGWFDYASLIAFSGARLTALPTTAMVKDSVTGESRRMSAPMVMEEDPNANINRNLEPGHANVDRLGTWHPNHGGNFAAIDGSAQQFNASEGSLGPMPIADWSARAPSGNVVDLHHTDTGFGDWNSR